VSDPDTVGEGDAEVERPDVVVAPPSSDAPGDETSASHDEPASEGAPEPHDETPALVLVEVASVVFHLPSANPVLHLRELELPYRSIHFPIGLPEAQAIALALEHERSARPTTAELLSSVVSATGSDVVAVRLTGTKGGTMLAELDLMTPRGHEVLDCRPTDGIALALRQRVPAPILCESSMLEA
jgi:uncharacterized protein